MDSFAERNRVGWVGLSLLLPLPFLLTLPTLLLLLDLYSLPALSPSLNNMHFLLFLHSLTSLPIMLDLIYPETLCLWRGLG